METHKTGTRAAGLPARLSFSERSTDRNKKSSFGYLGGFSSQLMISKDGIGVEEEMETWVGFETVLAVRFMGLSEHVKFWD